VGKRDELIHKPLACVSDFRWGSAFRALFAAVVISTSSNSRDQMQRQQLWWSGSVINISFRRHWIGSRRSGFLRAPRG